MRLRWFFFCFDPIFILFFNLMTYHFFIFIFTGTHCLIDWWLLDIRSVKGQNVASPFHFIFFSYILFNTIREKNKKKKDFKKPLWFILKKGRESIKRLHTEKSKTTRPPTLNFYNWVRRGKVRKKNAVPTSCSFETFKIENTTRNYRKTWN